MKGMIRLVALVAPLLWLAGCSPASDAGDGSLLGELPASYRGNTPCADCNAIREELALFADGALVLERVYLGPGETRRDSIRGSWKLNDAHRLSLLDATGQLVSDWQVAENGDLLMPSADGSEGATRLVRLPQYLGEPLEDRYWRLLEVDGRAVEVSDAFTREPHLVLHSSELRVAGSNGCNRLMGTYRLGEGARIDFGELASTRRACHPEVADMAQAFEKALYTTSSWRILANHLELRDEAGDVVASLEVVHF